MKVFISADIEGITTISRSEECDHDHPSYPPHAEQMTNEVLAVCEGALKAGAKQIVIRDAHGHAHNIDPKKLPKECILIRGWSGCPNSMVEGINSSFDAAMFVGYHAAVTRSGNSLSHTLSGANIAKIVINERLASEFLIYSWAAAYYGVPSVFLAGDKMLCEDDADLHPSLITVAVKEGKGTTTYCRSIEDTLPELRAKSKLALSQDLSKAKIFLPDVFKVDLTFKSHKHAEKVSFFPDVVRTGDNSISFTRSDYYEVLRTLKWVVY
jgi:D-amino peptidase